MLEISRFRSELDLVLNDMSLSEKDILLFAECDMTDQMTRGNTFLLMTENELYVIKGILRIVSNKNNSLSAGKITTVFEKADAFFYSLSGLENIMQEDFISSGRLTAKYENENTTICFYSNRTKDDVRLFLKYLQMYIKDKEIKPDNEDFKKENFCPKCGSRYPDANRKVCPKCMDRVGLLKKLFPYIKKYKFQTLIMVVMTVMVSVLAILAPYISSGFFYDQVLDESGKFYGAVMLVLFLVVGTTVLKLLANMVSGIVTAKVSSRMVYDIKKTIFASIKRLSLSFFTGRQTGGLMTQINNDANSIYWFFVEGMSYFFVNIIQFIIIFIILLFLNPLIALCSMVTVPVSVYLVFRIQKKHSTFYSKFYSSMRQMNSAMSDSLSGARVVKAFSREKEEVKNFNEKSEKFQLDTIDTNKFGYIAYPWANLFIFIGSVIVWGLGGWLAIRGDITYGTLATFVAYFGMMLGPMYSIVDMTNSFSEFVNSLQRLFEIADAEPDVVEKEKPVRKKVFEGKLSFKNVDFSYIKGRKTLKDISFEIEPGKIIGIVGHTGAGKSTLVNLLIRLYDVENGEISIDDVNIKDIAMSDLRNNIAIVSQETYLFIGTLLENIRYAKPDATYREVITAAKIAGAHDFIIKMPDGYETKVGLGLKDLSGGERQRISIARAVLKDPRILILDEATAAMDTETERKIQDAISILVKNRTTIMIAHRLSTLRDADKLIVIEDGKMTEFGTHVELLAKKGVYHKLYKLQMEALKNVGVEE